MAADEQVQGYIATPSGATIQTAYVERNVRAYAVFETEVESLSYLNVQATIFFSVASALFSFAIGIWTNAIFNKELSPAGELATKLVAPGLLVLSVVFVVLAILAWRKRKSTIQGIRAQSHSESR